MVSKGFKTDNNKIIEGDANKVNKTVINIFKFKKLKNDNFRNLIYMLIIKALKKPIYLTFSIKKIFNYL